MEETRCYMKKKKIDPATMFETIERGKQRLSCAAGSASPLEV